jgi:hypothetical protein
VKKIIVYLIIAIFLISTIAAQPLTAQEKRRVTATNAIAANQITRETANNCIERLSKTNPDLSEDALKRKCQAKPTLTTITKARKITQAKLAQAKEAYVTAKERYQTARKNYIATQNTFKEAKENIRRCRNNSEECNEIKEQIKGRAKEFLLKTADRILEHINKVKAKVESNEDLSEEETAEILGKIDGMIKEIEDAKATIENSEDKKEIIDATKKIKRAGVSIKKRLSIHTGRVVNARIGGIIVKIRQLETKLEKILERMEEKGIDTSDIQVLVDEFKAKTDEAKENYENALDKFKEASSTEDVEAAHELATEGNKYMKESHKKLQEAQKLLRDIVLSIKQKGGQDDLKEVSEEETEDEETDEDETDDDDEEGGDSE